MLIEIRCRFRLALASDIGGKGASFVGNQSDEGVWVSLTEFFQLSAHKRTFERWYSSSSCSLTSARALRMFSFTWLFINLVFILKKGNSLLSSPSALSLLSYLLGLSSCCSTIFLVNWSAICRSSTSLRSLKYQSNFLPAYFLAKITWLLFFYTCPSTSLSSFSLFSTNFFLYYTNLLCHSSVSWLSLCVLGWLCLRPERDCSLLWSDRFSSSFRLWGSLVSLCFKACSCLTSINLTCECVCSIFCTCQLRSYSCYWYLASIN